MPTDPTNLDSAAVRAAVAVIEAEYQKAIAIQAAVTGAMPAISSSPEAQLMENLLEDRNNCRDSAENLITAVNALNIAFSHALAGTTGPMTVAQAFASLYQFANPPD